MPPLNTHAHTSIHNYSYERTHAYTHKHTQHHHNKIKNFSATVKKHFKRDAQAKPECFMMQERHLASFISIINADSAYVAKTA